MGYSWGTGPESPEPALTQHDHDGACDCAIWVPPITDAIGRRPRQPCPHCGSPDYHYRTRRCAQCGRRPTTTGEERP